MTIGLNILALMKQLSICLKMIKKITTYTKLYQSSSNKTLLPLDEYFKKSNNQKP